MEKYQKTYSPKTDATLAARDAVREEMEKQRAERRKSQVELIRLHFACAWREGLMHHFTGDPSLFNEASAASMRDRILAQAWADADAFIKKGEQE